MDITLYHKEIEDAVKAYVENQGMNVKDRNLKVTLTAGRGEYAHSAIIAISDDTPSDSAEYVISKEIPETELVEKSEDIDMAAEEEILEEVSEDSGSDSLFKTT